MRGDRLVLTRASGSCTPALFDLGSAAVAEPAWLDDTAVRVIIGPVDAQSRLLVDVTVSARGLTM